MAPFGQKRAWDWANSSRSFLVRFVSPKASMAVSDSFAPSPSHGPFSRVGVSTNCSCIVNNAEWRPRSKTASTVLSEDVKVPPLSSGTASCRVRTTMFLVVRVSPGSSIWRYRNPR